MSEWINVDSEKPNHEQCVDIWIRVDGGYDQGDEGRITDVFFNEKTNEFWLGSDDGEEVEAIKICCVTHWMPTPERPEEN